MSIFKDCDIRGVYQKELNDIDGYQIGRALATLRPCSTFTVGGDVRISTPALKRELIRGLVDSGAHVLDMGQIATPVMYFSLHQGDAASGAMVTASHNPAQYNGIKFMLDDRPATRKLIDELHDIIQDNAYASGAGSCKPLDVLPDYFDFLKKRFGTDNKLRVVIDAGNGAMSAIAPHVFASAGYHVTELFCEADGTFPNRSPNPSTYTCLGALQEKVLISNADFGIAFDGDGDRVVFVDDKGAVVYNERALVLFIQYLLKDNPAPVVYDQKSSSIVQRAVLALGGTPVPERSGHAFIKRRFLDLNAPIAGEVSGHFFFGEIGYDDGLFAALLMGKLLVQSKAALSELLKDIVFPPISPDLRIQCPYAEQDALLDRLESAYAAYPISRLDGVRVTLPDGWLLMRKSVTAEQVTLRIEGESVQAFNGILQTLSKKIPETQEVLSNALLDSPVQ